METTEQLRTFEERGFPHTTFPTGWFQVAWAGELEAGGVMPLHFFGKDLVLFRGADGEAQVIDGVCAHLGAALGHGGKVCGNNLQCPFHGWTWRGDGSLADVPYSSRLPHVSLKSWPTREVSGMVYVWHDHRDGPPTWDAPSIDEYDDPAFHDAFPHAYARDRLAMHPQFAAENFPDMVHMQYVHEWIDTPVPSLFELEGHRATTIFEGEIPTPRGPLRVENIGLQFGVGINFARITGSAPSTTIGAFTPIDDTTSMAFISVFVSRQNPDEVAPTGLNAAIARANLDQMMGNGHDRIIFEHMTYQPRPILLPEEAANYRAYRRWTQQFYPAETAVLG